MKNYRKLKDSNSIIWEKEPEDTERYVSLAPNVYKLIDVGTYTYIPMFEPIMDGDKLVKFKSGVVSEVISNADKFFSDETRKVYEELKLTHKIGVLFYGKPGTGKTSTCMLIMKELVEKHGAICLDCTGRRIEFIKFSIAKIRENQLNPIVVFGDEFDSMLARDEDRYLTFLDGTDSVNNMIFIGCTNYLDKVPERFKKRKSRFKHLHNINSLPQEIYKEYLIDRVPSMKSEIVAQFSFLATERGLTIDQLKHALIDHKIEGLDIENAIEKAATFEEDKKQS